MEQQTFGGARALERLHSHHLRAFFQTWQAAKAVKLPLPPTSNPQCSSLDAIAQHVLNAAVSYLQWICAQVEIPCEEIKGVRCPQSDAKQFGDFLEFCISAWARFVPPLTLDQVEDGRVFTAQWGEPFTIDSMLEHAVMHPIRHEYQLATLLSKKS